MEGPSRIDSRDTPGPPLLPKLPHAGLGRSPGRALRTAGSAGVERFSDYFTWPAVRLFGLLYLVGISNGHVNTLVLLGLLGWCVTGPTQALAAMSLVAVFRFANGAIASFSPVGTLLCWLITMAASVRLYRSARGMSAPVALLLGFSAVALLLSLAVSKAPDVSAMKVVSFCIVGSAVLLAAPTLRPGEVAWLQRWFFSMALTIALLSVLVIPFPSISSWKVPGSLQGMFSHPQALGVFYVPFAAWFITRIFLEPIRLLPRWLLLVAGLFAALIVASDARTAMLATFLSVTLALVIVLFRGRLTPAMRSRGQIVGFAVVLALLASALLATGALDEQLHSVVFKDDAKENVGEAFAYSRGAGMAQQIDNFLDAPLTGHGFGVYREGVRGGEAGVKRFMGIPISASAEKGVVFTSVLEETGIFGGLLFYGLLLAIVGAAVRGAAPGATAMVIGCLAVNLGEAVFFSTGGLGLMMWALIGFGLARAGIAPVFSPSGPGRPSRQRRRPPRVIK